MLAFGTDHAHKSDMTFTLGPRAIAAGHKLATFDQIGSTNAEAMLRARDGDKLAALMRRHIRSKKPVIAAMYGEEGN